MEEGNQCSDGEGSQGSDGERSQSSDRERSYDYPDDDVYVGERSSNSSEDRSYDSGEHRSDSSNSDERRPKRRRTKDIPKQDRISAMPDQILLHILSFLPTKVAVKTGTLSRRWLYLWTFVPNLDFTYTESWYEEDRIRKFVTFVDQTLIFHTCCDVKKFIVDFEYEGSFASRVDTWVRFATRANVEELCLDLRAREQDTVFFLGEEQDTVDDGDRYVLPQYIYTNSSIRKLSLSVCDVLRNGLISWKSLKSLTIGYTKLSEEVIQKILVGSPVLEFLELHNFCGVNRLDIGSASLRKLVVRDNWVVMMGGDEPAMEISAPSLQSLSLLGTTNRKKFMLMNIQSLVDCNLNFNQINQYRNNDYEVHRNMLRELLEKLRHVKKLTIGNCFIQVLSMLELKGMLSPLSKCGCLILDTHIKKCHVPGIVGLLRSSPNLETLVINMTSPYNSEFQFDKKFPENYWTSRKGSFKCSLLHLKTVKIVGFVARRCGFELVIPLVKFLLEKARVLEKMVINLKGVGHMECSPKELLQVAKKLLSLPRSSPHAVVVFSE